MCLLITADANIGGDLEDNWLEDFFSWNKDGYGFMYAADRKLHIYKNLGDVAAFKHDWKRLAGVDRAVHLRMRTHGDIDLENCHPYEVIPGEIALMHNGILGTGNDADKTKSDTWHFIRDYLRPLLQRDPDLMFEPAFQEMLGDFIGAENRFVMLDRFGGMAWTNYESGVEWREMWMSNEYAWSSPNNKKWDLKTGRGVMTYDDWEYDNDYKRFRESLAGDDYKDEPKTASPSLADESPEALADHIIEAIDYLDRSYYKLASGLNRDHFTTFAVQRGATALWGAVEDLIDGDLDEQQFCRLIKYGTLYAGEDGTAYDHSPS